MYKKTTTTVEEFFDSAPTPPPPVGLVRTSQPKIMRPILRIDVPLMIRLFEYMREEVETDIEIHEIVERMIELCEYGEVLEMEHYDEIIEKPEQPVPELKPIAPESNS
jgi:hypothetical protein